MDDRIARWCRVALYSPEDLRDLQERETRNAKLNKRSDEYAYDFAAAAVLDQKYGLLPFWEAGITDQSDRISEFERMIYPIWRPIFDGDRYKTGLERLHAADVAIQKSGIRVNRFAAAGAGVQAKKAAIADKMGKVFS